MSATLQQIEQEILALFQAAEDYNALNLSTVYDIILTFPREMELFWRWSTFTQLSVLVLFALLGLWLAEVSIVWTFTFLNVSATHITHPPPGYPLPGCVSNSTPAKFVHLDIAAWVAGSFVSLCFFILVVVKFLQNLEYDFSWRSIKTMNVFELQRLAPVLVMFMRDGILYFLLILTCNIVELFMTCVLANRPSSECAMGWFIASYGVASSRLYLNLRESVAQKEETLDYELDDYALEFRVPTQASMDAMTHLGE
ncbi:hypothetical protein OBBRIDRAFT_838790 [Obba rivulosa]|uniref:DUF6533 domain-containing protein n=1 Tax=Obba rivulosa TaxID=1052685 RepID=A0A8E2DG65_9APHY|nr:hypothetical protein OBBRIDRAFT_838790 [Obba rivulosa]